MLTGCSDNQALRPEHTVVGPKEKSHPNWVDETQLYTKDGLFFREDFRIEETDSTILTGNENAQSTNNLEVVEQVYFDYNNSNIRVGERDKLQKVLKIITQNPKNKFLLTGHCDWHGTQVCNMSLRDLRENSAHRYLTQLGV